MLLLSLTSSRILLEPLFNLINIVVKRPDTSHVLNHPILNNIQSLWQSLIGFVQVISHFIHHDRHRWIVQVKKLVPSLLPFLNGRGLFVVNHIIHVPLVFWMHLSDVDCDEVSFALPILRKLLYLREAAPERASRE